MLKVMTLNLNYFGEKHGPWEARRELICEIIDAAWPDVVALQAAGQRPGEVKDGSQAAELQDMLPIYEHLFFQPATALPDGSTGGNAILSRLELSGTGHLPLTLIPGQDDDSRRVVQHARFERDAGPLHLFNAHFSWVEEQGRQNIDEALQYMSGFTGRALLVGDFNIPAGSGLLAPLVNAGWTDAWAVLRPGDEGLTFESDQPSLRIDYAWANQDLRPALQEITIIANTTHASGARPSDHFGLLVTLDI